jgi:hypothetical protein
MEKALVTEMLSFSFFSEKCCDANFYIFSEKNIDKNIALI